MAGPDQSVTEALIGLIGVVAGALLGGLVRVLVDRQRQQLRARVAARLIAAELGVVVRKLQSAVKTGGWWAGELPTQAWRGHLGDLAVVVSNADLNSVQAAYESIDTWNADKVAANKPNSDELSRYQASFGTVRDRLIHLSSPARSGLMVVVARWAMLVVAFLAAIGLLNAILAPRAYLDSAAVAAAVQSQFGNRVFVDCTPAGAEWSCSAHQLSDSRAACQVEASDVSTPEPGLANVIAAAPGSASPCAETAPPAKLTVSAEPGLLVVTSAEVERSAAHAIYSVKIPTRNALQMFLAWLTGRS